MSEVESTPEQNSQAVKMLIARNVSQTGTTSYTTKAIKHGLDSSTSSDGGSPPLGRVKSPWSASQGKKNKKKKPKTKTF